MVSGRCCYCSSCYPALVVVPLLYFLLCSYFCPLSLAFIVSPLYLRHNTHHHQYYYQQQQQQQQQLSTRWIDQLFASCLRHQHPLHAPILHARTTDRDMFWPKQQQQHGAGDDEDDDEDHEDDHKLSSVLDSIIKIHCTHSEPDYLIPWQRQHQSTSTSSGFVIALQQQQQHQQQQQQDDTERDSESRSVVDRNNENNINNHSHKRIITNAHSVEYASIVQVQRRGDAHKYEAVVEVIANECDLALLQVHDDEFWGGQQQDLLEPLQFGTTLPALQEEVEVLGYPTGGDSLSITSGVVSRMEMQEYSQASAYLLAIQIDAAINPGNSGGPVVNEDLKVIGVAFQGLEGTENIGYVVPVTVVQHLLHDIQRSGRYTGFCSLGIGISCLENTSFRRSLGMLTEDNGGDIENKDADINRMNRSGIMVKEVVPTAASYGILLPNDVICEIDGIPVANDGKIPFRRGERVALACYIQTKFAGDTVRLQVLRNGREMTLDVPVSISKRLVPAHWDNRPPPYLIVAGLVFTVLSVPFLHASEAWEHYVSENVSYLLGKWNDSLERECDQVVVLAQVLAHRENLGYDKLNDLHLKNLNGTKVRSLAQLKRLIDECQERFIRFEFAPNNQIVVMERASLQSVTDQVCKEHSIQKSFYLHPTSSEGNLDDTNNETALAEALDAKASINGSVDA